MIISDWDIDIVDSKYDNMIKMRKLNDLRSRFMIEDLIFYINDKNMNHSWSLYEWKPPGGISPGRKYTVAESVNENPDSNRYIIYHDHEFIDYYFGF
jgi:hypothetical protein